MTEGFRVSQIVLHYIQPICLLDTSLGNFRPVATLVGHTRGPVDTLPLCSLVSFAGFISSVHPLSFFPSSLYGSLGDLTLSKVSCLIDAFKNVPLNANSWTLSSPLYSVVCTLGKSRMHTKVNFDVYEEKQRNILTCMRMEWCISCKRNQWLGLPWWSSG